MPAAPSRSTAQNFSNTCKESEGDSEPGLKSRRKDSKSESAVSSDSNIGTIVLEGYDRNQWF